MSDNGEPQPSKSDDDRKQRKRDRDAASRRARSSRRKPAAAATAAGPSVRFDASDVDVPPDAIREFALLPLTVQSMIMQRKLQMVPQFTQETGDAISACFTAWLHTLDFEITPGWALIGLYCNAMWKGFKDAKPLPPEEPSAPPAAPPPTRTTAEEEHAAAQNAGRSIVEVVPAVANGVGAAAAPA